MLDDKRPGDKSVADLERDDHDNGADPHPNGTQNSTQNVVVVDKGAEASSAPSVLVANLSYLSLLSMQFALSQ